MRILAVDGDENCLRSIELMLGAERFKVYGIDSGEEAISLGKLYDYDAIVLSETPDAHTDTVIRSLRNAKVKTPLLVLSCVTDGAVRALDLGADDFMTKPFHGAELAARVNALVRRSKGLAQSTVHVGPLKINLATKTCEVAGAPVHLTRKEYEMLELLMLRKGLTLTKDAILTALYGGMDEPELKIIDVFICKLRRKLTNAGAGGLIETVWGRGYVIRPDAEPSMAPEVRDMINDPPTGRVHNGKTINQQHAEFRAAAGQR